MADTSCCGWLGETIQKDCGPTVLCQRCCRGVLSLGPKAWSLELDAPDAPREFPFRRGLSGLAGHRRTLRRGELHFSKTRPGLALASRRPCQAFIGEQRRGQNAIIFSNAIANPSLVLFQAVTVMGLCTDPNPRLCSDETFGSLDHEHLVFGGETGPKRTPVKSPSSSLPANAIDSPSQILVSQYWACRREPGPFTNHDKSSGPASLTNALTRLSAARTPTTDRSGCPDKRVVGSG